GEEVGGELACRPRRNDAVRLLTFGVMFPVGDVEERQLQDEDPTDEPAEEMLPPAPTAQEHFEVEDRPQHDTQHRRGCRWGTQPARSPVWLRAISERGLEDMLAKTRGETGSGSE